MSSSLTQKSAFFRNCDIIQAIKQSTIRISGNRQPITAMMVPDIRHAF